jgi:cobyrinic acid a,c-diamide synthase
LAGKRQALVIAGTHSGCGKTTLALGLMAALKARGLRVQPFKVGPDFIDPGLHAQITGFTSRNLDGWMLSREYNCRLFTGLLAEARVAVVEGVMGLFDGYDGLSESGSTAEMAKWLGLPVVLVVDARSMARSVAALVRGFADFDQKLRLAGVIFNRIGGPGHLDYLTQAMTANLPGIRVLGGIPREDRIRIPERHLGLLTADEARLDGAWQERLVELFERYVDLKALLEAAEYRGGGPQAGDKAGIPRATREASVVMAVARDPAFCFYYPDNLEMLEAAGAELRLFSPLAGESIPAEASGVYLGGGYPELFAETLSNNLGFLDRLRVAAAHGMPVYAECGGLMVLSRWIETLAGERYPMTGVLPFGTRMLNRRQALGYTEVVLQEDCLLGQRGTAIRGHEFHYSEIAEPEATHGWHPAYRIQDRKTGSVRSEGYRSNSVLASYIHLHWGSAPEAPRALMERCRQFQQRRSVGQSTQACRS